MPGANEKVTVTVDILGDISKFQNSVKAMQTELGKLQLPGNLKEGFSQIFTDLEREINKIQTIGSKKKIDLVDSKALTKSFSTMEGLYTKLLHKMQNSGMKTSLFEKDVQALQKVNNLLATYDNKIKTANKSMSALNGQVTKQTNNLKKLESKEGFTVISDEAYQDAQNKLANLKKAQQDATKAATAAEGTDEYSALLVKQTEATKKLEEAKRSMANIKSESQYQVEIENTTRKLEDAKRKVEEFKNSNKSVETSAWQELINQLTKIQGIDWNRFGIDPSKITSVEELQAALEKMGRAASQDAAAGIKEVETAAENMGSSLNSAVTKAEQTAQSLKDLGDRQHDIQQLASRLTHFFSLTNQFMIMRRIIQNAITTIKELDKAMTETAVVTDFNVADMWAQLPEYTKVANELGATTKGAYETMTLFYQQGLNQQQAFQLGTETMKMARIAGLEYAEATDRMTNALRGFNMELNDVSSQRVNDVYSNLAAKSASNVDELSTAMTKTASIAHAANMEFETTAAFLAQIIETTRESAETAGTALKTVIARFSEVKKLYSEGELTGQDEEGEEIDVNRVSTALRAAGVNLNEYLTGAKGLDEVFIELASKWDGLDLVTQRYIATMAAGSRQQSRFIALMQDYSRQTELVSIAENAAGASQQQFQKTLDSLEAKLNKLSNAWNEFTMGIANSSLIKGAIDLITGLITAINKITSALGPVGGAITKVLLLFAGFKGVRVLFDKFIGHIAKTYIDVARKAGVAGMGAGQAYGKGFLVGSKSALSKFKNIFVDVTTKSFKIDSGAITNITKSYGDYEEATKKLIIAQQALDAERIKSKEIILGTAAAQDLETAKQGQAVAQKAFLEELESVGITNDKVQLDILNGKISATELLKAVEDEEARAKIFNTIATDGEVTATKQDIEATLEDIAAKNALQTTHVSLFKKLAVGIIVLFTHTSAQKAANLVTEEGTRANISLALSFEFLNKTIMGLPLGWFIAILAGIVALITAISMASHEFSLEGKIEDAANLTKSLDEELKAVQNTLDEFDNHVSSIETLKDELAELTTGTQEWSNKVQELNNQYIELAKLIGSDFWQNATIENGAINVDDKYLQEAQQKILDQQVKLQQESVQASAMTTDLNLRQSGTSLIKDNNIWANMANSLTPGANVMIEGASSALAESVKDLSSEDIKRLMSAEDMESFNKITSSLLGGLTFDGDDVKEAQTELQNYINEVNSATAQMDASFQLMASNIQDKSINTESYGKVFQSLQSDNLKAIEDVGAEVDQFLFNAPQAIADVLNAKATQLGLEGHDLDNMEAAFDEYVRIMNESYGEGTFKREGWDIKKRTDEGNYEKVDIGAGEVAQRILTDWVNNQDFESAYKEHIDKIQEAMGKSFEGEDGRAALERIIGGNFTQEDIEKFGADTFKQLQDAIDAEGLNVEITPTLIKGGANAFISDLQGQINGAGIDVNASDLLGATTQKGQTAFLKLFDTKITGNKQGFANALMGLDNITEAEDFATIMEHLATIDFNDTKAWEALPDWLESVGINLPEDELRHFITQCEELAGAIDKIDLTKIESQLDTLYSSAEKIQKGDLDASAIDEDTYKKLIESEAFKESDFQKNRATGEYVYIAGQDSLETAIYDAIDALNNNAEAQLQERVDANEALEKLGEEKIADIKTDLSSDNMTDKGQGIIAAVRQWKKNGIDLETLGIEGLNNDTDIYNLTDDQKKTISQGVLEAIMNGVEGAKEAQKQFQGSTEYTEQYLQTQEPDFANYSGMTADASDVNIALIEEAASKVDNLEQKMEAAAASAKRMGLELSDLELKALATDIDKSQKAMSNLTKAFSESNKEILKTGRNIENFEEYDKALDDVTKAGQQLFGKGFDSSFAEKHLNEINSLINGTEQESYEAETAIRMALNPDLPAGLQNGLQNLEGEIVSVEDYINGIPDEIAVNGYADVSQMVNSFLEAGYTAEEALAKAEALSGFQISSDWVETGHKYIYMGQKMTTSLNGDFTYTTPIYQRVPQYEFKTDGGDGSGSRRGSRSGGKSGSGGGGGGGGGSKKEDNRDWKNPYDKLYNEYAKLEELQRKRNNLETQYNLIIDQAGNKVEQTNEYLEAQLKNLREQLATEKKIRAEKLKKFNIDKNKDMQAQFDTYEVEDGVRKTFKSAFESAVSASNKAHNTSVSADLDKYAWYDKSTGETNINWDLIQSLEGKVDSAVGEVLEAYVSHVEELEGQVEETEGNILNIQQTAKDILKQQIDNSVNFVDQMRQAYIDDYQKQIDALSSLNDTINESNQNIFDSLQEQIDLERQIRDNTKKEDDIAKTEARLAYLRRDTSGANDLEIKKLEESLTQQRQDYSDSLIDQEMNRLQSQADKAAAQREHQIQLMEKQLEYWNQTGHWNPLIQALDWKGAEKLWKEWKGYDEATEVEKIQIMTDFWETWNKGGNGAGSKQNAKSDALYNDKGKYQVKDAKGQTYKVSYNQSTDTWTGTDANGNKFSLTDDDIKSVDLEKNLLVTGKDLTSKPVQPPKNPEPPKNTGGTQQQQPKNPYGKASNTSGNIKKGAKGNAVKAIQYALNQLGYNCGSVDGIFGSKTDAAVRKFQKDMKISADGIVGKNTRAKFKAKGYSSGGLADYTGPAWLHGSKSKPELVLNAKDTENFIQLKDTLADVAKDSNSGSLGGDNYFDITIEVAEIGSDYDVEKMVDKIKNEIDQDARYRNVNSINFIR